MDEWNNARLLTFLLELKETMQWTTARQWWRLRYHAESDTWIDRQGERLRVLTYPQLRLVTEWAVDTPFWTDQGRDSRRYQLVALRPL